MVAIRYGPEYETPKVEIVKTVFVHVCGMGVTCGGPVSFAMKLMWTARKGRRRGAFMMPAAPLLLLAFMSPTCSANQGTGDDSS